MPDTNTRFVIIPNDMGDDVRIERQPESDIAPESMTLLDASDFNLPPQTTVMERGRGPNFFEDQLVQPASTTDRGRR
ncbi:hypothetical protein HY407_03115 [Candidatus Gottesmanbacteria bacterium]|nr:hypothetical protein [Candidatus Gottesmanbacteria bacterium]